MDPILTPILFLACTGLSCVLMVVAIAGLLLLVLSRNQDLGVGPTPGSLPVRSRVSTPAPVPPRSPAAGATRSPVSVPAPAPERLDWGAPPANAPPAVSAPSTQGHRVNAGAPTLLTPYQLQRDEPPPVPAPPRSMPAAAPEVTVPLPPGQSSPSGPSGVSSGADTEVSAPPQPRPSTTGPRAPALPLPSLGAPPMPLSGPLAAAFREPESGGGGEFGAHHLPNHDAHPGDASQEEEIATVVAPPPGLLGAPPVPPPPKAKPTTSGLTTHGDASPPPRTSGSTIIAFDDDDEDW